MKFAVHSSELGRALGKVHTVIPARSTSPILENILFELVNDVLTLTATDTQVFLSVSLGVQAKEDGRIAVPARRILDTVRSLSDEDVRFDIDTTANRILLTTRNGEYSIMGENAKEFPSPPPFKGSDHLQIGTPELKKIIHRTLFAVSADELRPAMMGVLLQTRNETLRAVATDGHRLVRVVHRPSRPSGLKRDIVIPAKALLLLMRTMETGENTISLSETDVRIGFDRTVLTARLIEEAYPNYESVIPQDNDKDMVLQRDALIASLRRVALYASAATHQVRFDVTESSLRVSAQDADLGGEARESLPCTYTGTPLEIGFNSTYLLDMLTHLDDEKVCFRFSAPNRAGIISPAAPGDGADDIIMLVMPVRLTA
ncbi:MAG: DNA polymerase III subunit beta [Bacteroidota bacterium]